MLTVVSNKENSRTVSMPIEEMKRLGINDGDEIEFSKNENAEIIIRSTTEAERKKKFEAAKNKIFDEWHDVFVELAKGADDSSLRSESVGKFVLHGTSNNKYKFNLTASNGQILFESAIYETRSEANEAIESLKKLLNGTAGEISEFTVENNLEAA